MRLGHGTRIISSAPPTNSDHHSWKIRAEASVSRMFLAGHSGGNGVSICSIDPDFPLPPPVGPYVPPAPPVGFPLPLRPILDIINLCMRRGDDSDCSPPVGTKCYQGPDTTHDHAGLNPHYHIFQMFKFNGQCSWKYLGGKVGRGVLGVLPRDMLSCSAYSGFQGR